MPEQIGASLPALEQMAKQLDLVKGRLTELAEALNSINTQMQGGALVGIPGDNFEIALDFFHMKVTNLADEYAKEALAIRQALSDMEQADGSAGSSF